MLFNPSGFIIEMETDYPTRNGYPGPGEHVAKNSQAHRPIKPTKKEAQGQ
jgi:hypothetical protein